MLKRYQFFLILTLFTLIGWTYWKSKLTYYGKSFIVLKSYKYITDEYLLEPPNKVCSGNPYVVIIVTSYVGHVELRSAHRRAISANYLRKMRAERVFLLANIPDKETTIVQAAIKDENEIFGDILQGSFEENYRNLTHKHLMGLRWASTQCRNATFIIKADDDTVFNMKKTYDLLKTLEDTDKEKLLLGKVLTDMIVKRERQNKWFVTDEEFGRKTYPPYLSGWFYVTTPQMAARLTDEAPYHPYFWIDDVFVTGILTEALNIELQDFPTGFFMDYYELVECCMTNMIRKNIKCDHSVGPNGGRNNLIVEFNRAFKMCSRRKECRSDDNHKSCVVWRDRQIFSEGKGEIAIVKFKK